MYLNKIQIHNIDFKVFAELIEKCEGNVYLETEDGNRLNLKSKLCQLLVLSDILKSADIKEASIICENKNDESMLFRYNLFREEN